MQSAARPRFFHPERVLAVKNLQQATERICELKGSLIALDALIPALLETLAPAARLQLGEAFEARAEAARTILLHADVSDLVLAAFERDVLRHRALLQGLAAADAMAPPAA